MSTRSGAARSHAFRRILAGIPSGGAGVDGLQSPALNHAIALGHAAGARLSLYVFAPLGGPMSVAAPVWTEDEAARLEAIVSAAARAAAEAIAQAGLEVAVEHPSAPFEPRSQRFPQLARVHDLTVLDAADPSDAAQRAAIEDALFDSGRPLLLVPRQGGTRVSRRVAIAWDGSAASARAVKDALPLLSGAETVVAVTVEGEKDLSGMAPGAELAAYLACHGVDCKLATLVANYRDVGERLRLFVAEEAIEMIVMGAFVHSRLRQTLLGGVTQSLLDRPPVPLFLAH